MRQLPIDTRPLFAPLDQRLLQLLKSLNEVDWHRPTVAGTWVVKDVVSHMVDTKLRTLSIQRDQYFGDQAPPGNSYAEFVSFINQLNGQWVQATKRLSPGVLIFLLEAIGDSTSAYYNSLDPWEPSIFPVHWAGETSSYNWMHLAREYTEYWHHQQQIRDAVGQPGILTREFFHPVINTFFRGLPHTFREVSAPTGTLIQISISSTAGGHWHLKKAEAGWQLTASPVAAPNTTVSIPVDLSWKLFTKSLRPQAVKDRITITGDQRMGRKVLELVAVIA
ncbi:maleylpyruvate isomerase family mycothiol-dependent enzyme [Lewinella sp. W8]|uniref:maleylpyruvate isomerase family mycothiol-dependent enzyme n=1 Tax=Lewinella sp. W8 TaxID=2528208 RepID=UPI001067B68D|nr:maleylpyruvate isomerase family mycothiol-dependent enzyme [Lewinella sp. W8]MTB51129.1 maleylpyruvate isomerase family mycothiol-dependent enzyme [Lewinella sp. W8]